MLEQQEMGGSAPREEQGQDLVGCWRRKQVRVPHFQVAQGRDETRGCVPFAPAVDVWDFLLLDIPELLRLGGIKVSPASQGHIRTRGTALWMVLGYLSDGDPTPL